MRLFPITMQQLAIFLCCASMLAAAQLSETAQGARTSPSPFVAAVPVWPKGQQTERNITVGFHTTFDAPGNQKVLLRATGATLYRVFLNGRFVGHGPARGPHGYYRVDEWDLTEKLHPGKNVVAFELAGYNANS